MKKSDIFFLLVDIVLLIDALIDVCAGVGTTWDFSILIFGVAILGILIVRGIATEIKIQKQLKQMREEEP